MSKLFDQIAYTQIIGYLLLRNMGVYFMNISQV